MRGTGYILLSYLVDYARIDDPTEVEIRELKEMKKQAVAQIKSYTGLTEEELDQHEDITQALVLLIMDAFDNRNLYIEGKASNINKAVESILSMHSINLL